MITREEFSSLLELAKEVAELKVRVDKLEQSNPKGRPKGSKNKPKNISNV